MVIVNLTYQQTAQRLRDIDARQKFLRRKRNHTTADRAEARELADEIADLSAHLKNLLRRDGHMPGVNGRARRALPGSGIRSGSGHDYDRDPIREPRSVEDHRTRDPWEISHLRTHGREPGNVAAEYRAHALDCADRMPGCSDAVRSASTKIIERWDSKDSRLARQCIVTSRPAYLRAFAKLACNKPHSLTQDEQRALADVEEFRALSLTDIQGGYLVPWQLDPAVIVTSTFVRSDLRQAARVVIATGDVWNGVSSQNVVWSFQAEGSETSDAAPPFGQPSIPVWMARGFIPISIEAMDDELNVTQEVGRLLANGKLDLEGVKFIVGSGLNEPTGIVTALGISGNAGSVTTTATSGTFALSDFYNLQGSLPAHYRPNASWLANNLIYNKIRQFDVAGGAGFWTNLTTERPAMLYGRDALEAEAMSGQVAGGNQILLYGDLESFVIVDRIGMAIEFLPHLFSTAHNRPTGTRGWFAWYRTGSDLVNPTGVRLLTVHA
jgi:HK97 family phage major capsid protein